MQHKPHNQLTIKVWQQPCILFLTNHTACALHVYLDEMNDFIIIWSSKLPCGPLCIITIWAQSGDLGIVNKHTFFNIHPNKSWMANVVWRYGASCLFWGDCDLVLWVGRMWDIEVSIFVYNRGGSSVAWKSLTECEKSGKLLLDSREHPQIKRNNLV